MKSYKNSDCFLTILYILIIYSYLLWSSQTLCSFFCSSPVFELQACADQLKKATPEEVSCNKCGPWNFNW